MFDNLGIGELLIIFLVILILFGSKKIPDLAQGLGKGIREFKKAIRDVEDDIKMPDNKSEKKNMEK
jgi:sec-independent protein translocase protein TatA